MRGESFLLLAILLVAAVAVTPSAVAASNCTHQETAGAEGYYVKTGTFRHQVWKESNDLAGLQTGTCTSGGKTYSKDLFVQEIIPQDPDVLGICFGVFIAYQCL